MRVFAIVVQNLIRLLFVTLLVLGFLFWSGHALNLVQLHMRLGELLAGLLWVLAILAILRRVAPALTILALAWGVLVVYFGMRLLGVPPGPLQQGLGVIHLLIGVVAIGLAEVIGARLKRAGRVQHA